MSALSGRNRNLIPELTGFVQKSRVMLTHTNRTAAAPDIAGEGEKLFYGDKLHILIPGCFCGFPEVKLTANRYAEYVDSGSLPSGYQGFENLFGRDSERLGGVDPAEIFFVKFVERFPTGNARLPDNADGVCFCCHMITLPIIRQMQFLRKSESIEIIRISYHRWTRSNTVLCLLFIDGKKTGGIRMNNKPNTDSKNQELDRIKELGSDITKTNKGNIYTLTIIGQVEGHQVAPDTVKTTKYEHVLPLLAGIEESEEIDGLLLLLNTVGGDIEAGLAIAEMIAGMKKPTVSLVLGGGHSIGIPLAVCTKKSFITPTASMTVHPVRMTGLVVGAPQTYRYFQRIQEQIADFVTANSKISRADFEHYMMATGEMATDVGTILYGKEAVASGLIDKLGGLSDALSALHRMIKKQTQHSQ